MNEFHYFDNAATTKICKEALDEYVNISQNHMANPSAVYSEGRQSKAILTSSREKIADYLGVKPSTLFFTSGASESISIVLSSLLWAKRSGEVIFSSIEHEAVSSFEGLLREKGWKVNYLGAKGGFVSPDELEARITPDTRLVAVMAVNNVLGTIQDIKSLVKVVREKEKEYGRSIFFFSDCVQALGKTGFSLSDLDVDGASFSAHKINGPRGAGLVYLKKGQIQVLSHAGGQEGGIRGGTENLPAIAAFAKAVESLKTWDEKKIHGFNTMMRQALADSKMKILSPDQDTSDYILSLSSPLPSEVAIRMMQDKGYLVSSGSACSNNARGKAEAVFRAAGLAPYAGGAIRVSFSCENTEEEVRGLIQALKEL